MTSLHWVRILSNLGWVSGSIIFTLFNSLNRNELGHEGAQALKDVLRVNTTLTTLE